ncbi:MAG: 2-oxoacid:acceptor oxidoreductase subunit alpha [Parcubacteria group bacterium]
MGGEAGSGIKNSALILAKAFVKGGYYVHANVEYPSIVRGGNNTLEVRMAAHPVRSLTGQVNLLAALDGRTLRQWSHEIVPGGVLLYDAAATELSPKEEAKLRKRKLVLCNVPLRKLLVEHKLPRVMLNTVMLGAICGAVCYDLTLLDEGLAEVFGRKGAAVVKANLRAAMVGYRYVSEHYQGRIKCQPKMREAQRILLEGNEAIVLGAIKAGMTSYTGYPMTPTSALLHLTAALKKKFNLFSYQPEDESAAIQMAIGASYAGVRAMTASSGGGFSLMVESLGLAAMTETPLVVVLGQRPGPSTGLPTRTAQGDVRFALHSGQDEPPRVVLAPGDPAEAFELTFHAFNIAEKYQLLVIILGDKYLQEAFWTHTPIKHARLKVDRGKLITTAQVSKFTQYQRFADTADGVSPRVLPGTAGLNSIWRVSSDEHNPAGFISEDRENRIAMVKKRRRKVAAAYQGYLRKLQPVATYGPAKAKTAVVSFGSNKGVLLDLLDQQTKPTFKVVLLRCLMPFPQSELVLALGGVKKILVVEGNDTGLLEGLVREQTGINTSAHLRFFDGRPLTERQAGAFLKKHT